MNAERGAPSATGLAGTRVLVTGASGHIGSNLVRLLLARGVRVRAFVHNTRSPALDGLDLEQVEGDVLDPASLSRALRGIDAVFHLAAVISIAGDPDGRVRRTNVEGPRNVARACLDAGVRRLVHTASVHGFEQEPLDEPLDERRARVTSPRRPAYDRSKAAGETEVRAVIARGLDAVITHPTGVIGPVDFAPSRMGQVLLDLRARRLLALVDGGFDWADVRDVCDGLVAAMERGRAGESYLLSGHWKSLRQVAEEAALVTGVPPPRFVSPMWMARIGAPFVVAFHRAFGGPLIYTSEALLALRANRRIVRAKAQGDLGYAPRPFVDTVRDTYAWFDSAAWKGTRAAGRERAA